jgi:RNA polymerase sigma-70 factor, ECF subfamily
MGPSLIASVVVFHGREIIMSMQPCAPSRFARPGQSSPGNTIAASLSRAGAPTGLSTIPATQERADGVFLAVRDDMLAAVPGLRVFAISLCGNADRADDFVQETLLRAIANIDSFRPGSNLCAWLFTILRNLVRSDYRKRRREVEDTDGGYVGSLKSAPEQHSRLELEEVCAALAALPPSQHEALLLVSVSNLTYDQAAAICEISVGTIKSRVSRARSRLSELLGLDGADRFGPDGMTNAVLTAGGRG